MRHGSRAPLRPALGVLIAGLLATLLPGPATPDDLQDQPPTFGTEAEVVMLDLVARGTNGEPVTDLRKTEVTVYEDGKPCLRRADQRRQPLEHHDPHGGRARSRCG